MAEVLRLTDTDDTISLIDSDGFEVKFDGWKPARAADSRTPVVETMELILHGMSEDDIADNLNRLNRMLTRAREMRDDDVQEREVWLEAQLVSETNTRRALIRDGRYEITYSLGSIPTRSSFLVYMTLALERTPAWESDSSISTSNFGIDLISGSAVYDDHGAGDMPGRFQVSVYPVTGTIDTLWMGFRSDRKTGTAKIGGPWEAESGSPLTDSASSSDSNASGNGKVRVSFASSSSLMDRLRIISTSAGGIGTQTIGRFLVLGRMQMTGGSSVARVRLKSGWYDKAGNVGTNWKSSDLVTVSASTWAFYELGVVKFPPTFGGARGVAYMNAVAIALEAEKTSGACSLDIDCFRFIPIDEGFVKVSGGYITSGCHVRATNTPKNTALITQWNATVPVKALDFSQHEWYVPIGASPSIHIAGQRSGSSVKNDSVDLIGLSYSRFFTLQGSAS